MLEIKRHMLAKILLNQTNLAIRYNNRYNFPQ